MSNLERSTYAEPDFAVVLDEFTDPYMTEEDRKKVIEKTIEMYDNFTDDDWIDLADNY